MYTRTARYVGVAVAALTITGCARKDSSSSAAASSPDSASAPAVADAPAPNVVTVTTSDYAFDAPDRVPAGLTTLHLVNKGPALHHIQLVKLDSGKTTADFLAALKAGGPPPQWASMAGGPNPPEAGKATDATLQLEPGTYAMVCFVPTSEGVPHVMKGMSRTLTVDGPAQTAASEPAADAVMTLKDYDFVMSKPLAAGKRTIRVDNAGPQPHEVVIVRLNAGRTLEDYVKWAEHPAGAAPGTMHGGTSAIMPGMHAVVATELPAGDYALICFVPDGKDGKPHFVHGMGKRITVT